MERHGEMADLDVIDDKLVPDLVALNSTVSMK